MSLCKLVIYSFILVCLAPAGLYSDSLWSARQGSLYSPAQREIGVGDIITIQVSEATSAAQEATTRTSKESKVAADFLSAFDQVSTALGNNTNRSQLDNELVGEDEYRGTGQTSRRSQVRAVVTAIVTEVLDSGNLFVVGEHKVKVNNEVETIRVSGVIRPQDISARNTVFSYQLATAKVSVNGAGVVSQKQSPGIVTKMFNWFF